MIRRCGLAAGAFLVAVLSACGGSSAPSRTGASAGNAGANLGAPAEMISAVDQLRFNPSSTTAHVGDIIQWTNMGSTTHTVTFDSNPSLDDASLEGGGTWEVRFTAAGTYAYHCSIHPQMTGTITVI